jgi:hypothetical protein
MSIAITPLVWTRLAATVTSAKTPFGALLVYRSTINACWQCQLNSTLTRLDTTSEDDAVAAATAHYTALLVAAVQPAVDLLRRIEGWELPPTGKFYPNSDGSDSDRPMPYDSFYANGSQGGRQAVRAMARAALGGTDHV